MKTLADRFRLWYDYERHCNAKTLEMIESVPHDRRSDAAFQKAIDKQAHLVAARRRWLFRLGQLPESTRLFPQGMTLAEISALIAQTEAAWVDYLGRLDDAELARVLEWVTDEGKRLRWDVEGILTQTFGHAWYHRGQIAMLVAQLGGKAVDTDYLLLCKQPPMELAAG